MSNYYFLNLPSIGVFRVEKMKNRHSIHLQYFGFRLVWLDVNPENEVLCPQIFPGFYFYQS